MKIVTFIDVECRPCFDKIADYTHPQVMISDAAILNGKNGVHPKLSKRRFWGFHFFKEFFALKRISIK